MLFQINGSCSELEGDFLAPRPSEAGLFISLETDETMAFDMTLGFRALVHIDVFSAWAGANYLTHSLTQLTVSRP